MGGPLTRESKPSIQCFIGGVNECDWNASFLSCNKSYAKPLSVLSARNALPTSPVTDHLPGADDAETLHFSRTLAGGGAEEAQLVRKAARPCPEQ